LRAYAKVAGCRLKIQNDAACVKIDAERKAGELLKQMAERGERRPKGGNQSLSHDATSLPDFGINRTQSSRWQRESAVRKAQGYALRAEIKLGELLAATERASASAIQRGGPARYPDTLKHENGPDRSCRARAGRTVAPA